MTIDPHSDWWGAGFITLLVALAGALLKLRKQASNDSVGIAHNKSEIVEADRVQRENVKLRAEIDELRAALRESDAMNAELSTRNAILAAERVRLQYEVERRRSKQSLVAGKLPPEYQDFAEPTRVGDFVDSSPPGVKK